MSTETERRLREGIDSKQKELQDYYKANKPYVMRDSTRTYVSQRQLDVWRENERLKNGGYTF